MEVGQVESGSGTWQTQCGRRQRVGAAAGAHGRRGSVGCKRRCPTQRSRCSADVDGIMCSSSRATSACRARSLVFSSRASCCVCCACDRARAVAGADGLSDTSSTSKRHTGNAKACHGVAEQGDPRTRRANDFQCIKRDYWHRSAPNLPCGQPCFRTEPGAAIQATELKVTETMSIAGFAALDHSRRGTPIDQ